jgi:hypothetical protein
MTKSILFTAIAAFITISLGSANAQKMIQRELIDLDIKSSCYFSAVKTNDSKNNWEITLSDFYQPGVSDTTFRNEFIEADTILKIILIKSGFREYREPKSNVSSYKHYYSYIREVKRSIEKSHELTAAKVLAGELKLKRNTVAKNNQNEIIENIVIQKVDMAFKDGFIDNISVIATINYGAKSVQFTNAFPIGLSSKKNIDLLSEVSLFSNHFEKSYQLKLTDFLTYNFQVNQNQYDYSPADTLLNVLFGDSEAVKIIGLNKHNKNKLFEYKIFTDLAGLNEDKPNGLIQIEASRKISLYTRFVQQKFPIGVLQYIEPTIKLNKIESKNAFLISKNADSFQVDSITQGGSTTAQYKTLRNRSLTTLDLYLYQQLSVGFNLNLMTFNNANTKVKFVLDGIVGFGRTRVRDSISFVDTTYSPYLIKNTSQTPKTSAVNTINWGFEGKFTYSPDARYGLEIGAKYVNHYLASLDFNQRNVSLQNALVADKYFNRGIFTSSIQLHKAFKNDAKFFVKYAFNSQANNFKNNFSQFQIGYNAFLKY